MAWTTATEVRTLTGLTSAEVSDADLNTLISSAQKEINLKLNTKIIRELVESIDGTRENDIDGSNTTFYAQNWKGNYFSDTNFDNSVTTSDVTLFSVDSDDVETESNPLSITADEMKWTVTTAPNDVTIYVTYSYSPFDMETPNPLVKLACEYLAGAYGFLKRDGGKGGSVRFGNVSISNNHRESYESFYSKYLSLVNDLKLSDDGGAIWGVASEII